MMRQAPTARKVLLLALVLLLGCQGDGGSRLLGWGWGLIDFICLPGWGRKMGVKVGGGRGVCHCYAPHPEHLFPVFPAFSSESVFRALYPVALQAWG